MPDSPPKPPAAFPAEPVLVEPVPVEPLPVEAVPVEFLPDDYLDAEAELADAEPVPVEAIAVGPASPPYPHPPEAPYQAAPYEAAPYQAAPYEAAPYEAAPYQAAPYQAAPYQAAPYRGPPPSFYAGQRLGPPRLVMAIGVTSIIVAALGLTGGAVVAVATFAEIGMVTTRAAMAAKATAASTVNTGVPGPAEVVDTGGLNAADRSSVIEGLARVRPLTPGQQMQLDELLAESGRTVVSVGTAPVDPALIAAGVGGSGDMGTLGTAGAAVDGSACYFVLPNGRLELTDSRAVYFPGDGQPAVRAVAYVLPPLPEPQGGQTAPPPPLTDDAIRSTLRNVCRLNGTRPKSAQVKALLDLLRNPNQQVVLPTPDGSDPAAEVIRAQTDPDGALTVDTVHAGMTCSLTVQPNGQSSAALLPVAPAVPVPAVSPGAAGGFLIAAAAQLAVAVYLLVIGILTVRRSRFGRVLHWVYVGVKLPLAAGAAVAVFYVCKSLPEMRDATWAWEAPTIAGGLYPLALVFALCGRSVRDYYARSVARY